MIVLQGICYDAASSFLKGAAKAPPLIRQYLESDSANSFSETGVDTGTIEWNDAGDLNPAEYMDIYYRTLSVLENDIRLITLGGDHSITFPVVKALHEVHGPFHILHFDAHSDLYHEFEGDPWSHACPFARIMENGLATGLTQLGIRTLNTHQREQADRFGVEIVEMKDLGTLPELPGPIYLSVDLDVLDPAFAPGISHYEPGGMSTRQLIDLILEIDVPIIGADIVEYNPERDLNGMTGMVAAKILKEIMVQIGK